MKKYRPKERRKARELAMQAIYQWQLSDESPVDIEVQFHQNNNMAKVDAEYFGQILRGVTRDILEIDNKILSAADRPLKELNPVELALLRIAVYEDHRRYTGTRSSHLNSWETIVFRGNRCSRRLVFVCPSNFPARCPA